MQAFQICPLILSGRVTVECARIKTGPVSAWWFLSESLVGQHAGLAEGRPRADTEYSRIMTPTQVPPSYFANWHRPTLKWHLQLGTLARVSVRSKCPHPFQYIILDNLPRATFLLYRRKRKLFFKSLMPLPEAQSGGCGISPDK